MLATYYTSEQIATVLGVDRKRVFDWKRAKVVTPALKKGEEQYSRGDVIKLALMLALKDVFGEKHGAPAKLASMYSEAGTFVGMMEGMDVIPGDAPIVLRAPNSDVELRVTIADAIRQRMAQVPA